MCTAAFLVQCCDISCPQKVYLEIKEMASVWRCCCQGWQPLFFPFDQHNGEREQVLEKLPSDLYKCAGLLWQVDPTHKLSVVNFFEKMYITIMCISGLPVLMSAPRQCQMSVQARSGYRIPWNWGPVVLSYHMSVRNETYVFWESIHWAVSQDPVFLFLKNYHWNCIQYTILNLLLWFMMILFSEYFFGFSLILFL